MSNQYIPRLLQWKSIHLPQNSQEQLELTKPFSLICCRPDICECCLYNSIASFVWICLYWSVSPFSQIFTNDRTNKTIKKNRNIMETNDCDLSHCCMNSIPQFGIVWFKSIRLLLIHNKTNAKEKWGQSTQTKNRRIKAVFLRNVWELPHDGSVSDRTPQPRHLFANSLRKQLKCTMRWWQRRGIGYSINMM